MCFTITDDKSLIDFNRKDQNKKFRLSFKLFDLSLNACYYIQFLVTIHNAVALNFEKLH